MTLLPFFGPSKLAQWLTTVLCALALCLLTFAASFAEVPYSTYRPSVTAQP